MKPRILVALVALVLAMGGCASGNTPVPDDRTDPEPGRAPATTVAELDVAGLSEVQYTFEDKLATPDVTLKVEMTDVTPEGATLTVKKRVAWTDDYSSATYAMTAEDVAAFWDIICEFDPVAWTLLGTASSYGGRTRNTLRFVVDGQSYYLNDMVRYPDTVPPVKDRFYVRLYNYFNAFVSADPAMEAVWSDDLVDPADELRYQDRTAIFRGQEVTLRAGTGSNDGYNAVIEELSGTDWWVDEELVGHWVQSDEDAQMNTWDLNTYGEAELWIEEDGTWYLTIDGTEYTGVMDENRYYRSDAGGSMEEPYRRGVTFDYVEYDDGQVWYYSVDDPRTSDHLAMDCEMLPYPEESFAFHVLLTRAD